MYALLRCTQKVPLVFFVCMFSLCSDISGFSARVSFVFTLLLWVHNLVISEQLNLLYNLYITGYLRLPERMPLSTPCCHSLSPPPSPRTAAISQQRARKVASLHGAREGSYARRGQVVGCHNNLLRGCHNNLLRYRTDSFLGVIFRRNSIRCQK